MKKRIFSLEYGLPIEEENIVCQLFAFLVNTVERGESFLDSIVIV